MSERYSTQESESVVSDLMQAAAGPYQDDELLDLTARSIRIIAAAMQDEIEFRAGFVRRSVEMEARADAAEQQRDAALAALDAADDLARVLGQEVMPRYMELISVLNLGDSVVDPMVRQALDVYRDRRAVIAGQPAASRPEASA